MTINEPTKYKSVKLYQSLQPKKPKQVRFDE
jgi:hypothetical protein